VVRARCAPARTVQLYLLDGFRLVHDRTPVVVPRGLQRVLALLALRPRTTRVQLAGLLWPDRREHNALSSLRTALWRIRSHAWCPLVASGDTVSLGGTVQVDVDALVAVAARIREGADPRQAAGLLATGRHDLLPGWYDDWVLVERERLRQLRLHLLEDLARTHLRAGQHGDALQAAMEVVRAEPLRETPHRLIVETHLAEGNAYEALHAFYVYRDMLRRDLQLEPSPAMRALLEHILSPIGEPAVPAAPHPGPAPGPRPRIQPGRAGYQPPRPATRAQAWRSPERD